MPNENLTSSAWFSCSFWVILSPYVHSPVSWRKSWSEPPWRQEIFFFPLICMGASIFAIWWPVQWPHSVSPCLRSFRNLKTGWRKRIETAHARAINHRTLRNWRKTHPKIEISDDCFISNRLFRWFDYSLMSNSEIEKRCDISGPRWRSNRDEQAIILYNFIFWLRKISILL